MIAVYGIYHDGQVVPMDPEAIEKLSPDYGESVDSIRLLAEIACRLEKINLDRMGGIVYFRLVKTGAFPLILQLKGAGLFLKAGFATEVQENIKWEAVQGFGTVDKAVDRIVDTLQKMSWHALIEGSKALRNPMTVWHAGEKLDPRKSHRVTAPEDYHPDLFVRFLKTLFHRDFEGDTILEVPFCRRFSGAHHIAYFNTSICIHRLMRRDQDRTFFTPRNFPRVPWPPLTDKASPELCAENVLRMLGCH